MTTCNCHMAQARRDFDELGLMMNVLIEDSQWLDSFQNRLLTCGSRDQFASQKNCSAHGCLSGNSDVQPEANSPALPPSKTNELEFIRNEPCKSKNQEVATSIHSSTGKRNRSSFDQVEEESEFPVPSHARGGPLSASLFTELPAPEFVKHNRSTISAEMIRLVRTSMISTSNRAEKSSKSDACIDDMLEFSRKLPESAQITYSEGLLNSPLFPHN
jgi:hypothetical protein